MPLKTTNQLYGWEMKTVGPRELNKGSRLNFSENYQIREYENAGRYNG